MSDTESILRDVFLFCQVGGIAIARVSAVLPPVVPPYIYPQTASKADEFEMLAHGGIAIARVSGLTLPVIPIRYVQIYQTCNDSTSSFVSFPSGSIFVARVI